MRNSTTSFAGSIRCSRLARHRKEFAMTAPMRDHPSAGSIRRLLDRNGLHTIEQWGSDAGEFTVTDGARLSAVLRVTLARLDGGLIRCCIFDLGRKSKRGNDVREYGFTYRDSQAHRLEKADRQGLRAIDTARRQLAECVARYALPELPPEPDADTLADRIHELIAADPEDAAERLAQAIAAATDAEKTEEIGTAIAAREPTYGN
jgi:hypothetical protein